MKCYDCQQEITDEIVWLGERDEKGEPFEFPFHLVCADQPWPLGEVRREPVPVSEAVSTT